MKSFLYELAENLHKSYKQLDLLTIVFPNRRAVIYFRKHLSGMLARPTFAPRMITIEDFLAGFSSKKVPDKLELIHRLYITYHNNLGNDESNREAFDKFYFWGDMLLRDFDELDRYLVPAEQMFKDLTVQKELDASFDFLTDEQREFLKSFWSGFEENITENKRKFLSVWNRLFQLYNSFRVELAADGLAYEGMMHREVAENIDNTLSQKLKTQIVFAGFNALTTAEEKIISYFVKQNGAKVFWDIDAYYVHNNTQEAGRFFRGYQRHDVLGSTFPKDVPANFMIGPETQVEIGVETNGTGTPAEKIIRLYGAAEAVSQAKVMAQILQEKLQQGLDPENTLIVLPDEKLLLPVLHGLSGAFEKLNVTMGFPLANTPIFSFAELLVDLQISSRQDHFNHREVLALLGHPYVVAADAIAANVKRKEILNHNWVHIPRSYLATTIDLHRHLFQEVSAASMLDYLRGIITEIGQLNQISLLDKEYAFNFLKLLNRMDEVIGSSLRQSSIVGRKADQIAMKSFLRLLRQLIQGYKIPFTGEPLSGLQIMGVLETRNLDYKNVFILSMNEGAIPASSVKGSYIPFNIRKAYGLPTVEHQDAIYAYLFYRVLQRAENIYLFYNSETDVLGQGEMSRYLQQLIYESGLTIEKKILHNPLQPRPIKPITITKTPEVLEALARLNEGNGMFRGISPSALNNYLECRLRFYLRHIAGIKEPREVEEDLDARVLGNFLHRVMELLYNGIREAKGNKLIEAADLSDTDMTLDLLIDQAFIEKYGLDPSAPVEYEGQRLVVREIVKRFARRIIDMDRVYAPFTLEATEQGGLFHSMQLRNRKVLLNGKIDRVDRKGNVLRVIDYKTGKDQLDFESIPSLFARDEKRNKAAFQTMLYALLYKSSSAESSYKIVPGLINRMNLFDKNFKFGLKVGKVHIDDVGPLLQEFEMHMTILLEELFSDDTPFDQTTDVENCRYCVFRGICYR